MFSRFIHKVTCVSELHSFLWLNNIINTLYVYIWQFFIHSSPDGHLGCFYFLLIVNSAAINIVHIFEYLLSILLGIYLGVKLLDHMVFLWSYGIKISGRNISNFRYADDTTVMAESEEELKSILMKVKEESEKASLKLSIQKMKIMVSGPITSWQIDGETMETVIDYFLGLQNHCRWWFQSWNWKTLAPWKKSCDQPRQHIKNQRHYFDDKGLSSQSYGFSNSNVWMWELDNRESWVPKNWCFWTVVLEKTLESPLDCKEIKLVNPKENQSWIFIGRTDPEAETPVLWPHDAKNWLIGKVPDAGKDWRQEEKGTTEDQMVGWHHWLNGHEFE